jgi:hypothetical protein
MTMHLAHPALTMGGKRKGKVKFRNSAEAQKARQLDAEWRELQKKWDIDADDKKRKRALAAEPLVYNLSTPVGRSTSNHLPSRNTGEAGAVTYKASPQYTGTKIKGIGTMHKSNAVPVFSDEEAHDIATMRRG